MLTVFAVCLWSESKSDWKAIESILYVCTGEHECRSTECTILLKLSHKMSLYAFGALKLLVV